MSGGGAIAGCTFVLATNGGASELLLVPLPLLLLLLPLLLSPSLLSDWTISMSVGARSCGATCTVASIGGSHVDRPCAAL